MQEALAQQANALRRQSRAGTWVAPNNMHLTLRFLGEVPEAQTTQLQAVGYAVAQSSESFNLTLTRLGAFPSPRRARVLWAGTDKENPQFATLARRLEESVQRLGFPPEEKDPVPHVTLARFRPPVDLTPVLAGQVLAPLVVAARELTLMHSELRPQGPVYTPVARWPLGG